MKRSCTRSCTSGMPCLGFGVRQALSGSAICRGVIVTSKSSRSVSSSVSETNWRSETIGALSELHIGSEYPELLQSIVRETAECLQDGFEVDAFVTHYEALDHSHPFFSGCSTEDVIAQHAAGSCVGPAPERAVLPRVLFAGLRRTRRICVAGRVQCEEFAIVGSGVNSTIRGHDQDARRDG
jgi:hypothetical protein